MLVSTDVENVSSMSRGRLETEYEGRVWPLGGARRKHLKQRTFLKTWEYLKSNEVRGELGLKFQLAC